MSEAVLATPVAAEPVETGAPVVESTPQPVEESGSIEAHQSAYGRVGAKDAAARDAQEAPAERAERDERGRFRHRAQSQKASAEDVGEISALTRQLREKERELAKVEPDALSGSPRVLGLKRQIEALDARLSKSKAPATPADEPAPRASATPKPAAPAGLREKPSEDQIGTKYQSYGDYVEDLTNYAHEKREFDRRQTETQTAQAEAYRQVIDGHQQRMTTFAKTTPDFDAVVTPFVTTVKIPNLLGAALMTDDNGPAYVYHLAQHPDVVDELYLLTDGKDITDANVAIVQRRLKQRAQAAVTGSAAPTRPAYTPPRPPNPVRTGPLKTDDAPPAGDHSLREHARHWGKTSRR